jgi:hypothetical protein
MSTHGSTDFNNWPTTGPPNAVGTGGRREAYGYQSDPVGRPEIYLGGVFYANDRPADTVSMTSITYGSDLDDEWIDKSGYYLFNHSNAPNTNGVDVHNRDPNYDGGDTIGTKYHFRGLSEYFGVLRVVGWDSDVLPNNFYFATPTTEINNAWYWTDTR